MISRPEFERLKQNVKYNIIRMENLDYAKQLAGHSRIKPTEEFFYFAATVDGQPLRLFYEWEEVWRVERLQEFRQRRDEAMEKAKEIVINDLKKLDDMPIAEKDLL